MNRNRFAVAMLFSAFGLLCHTPFAVSADACVDVQQAQGLRMSTMSEKYKQESDSMSQQLSKEAQSIKDQTPDTTGPDAAIGFDFDVKMKRVEFALDLPDVTLKGQPASFDIPTIVPKLVEWTWDNPTLVVRRHCQGGPDEVVCEQGTYRDSLGITWPKIDCRTRRGPDICFDRPEIEMRKEKVSFNAFDVISKRIEFMFMAADIRMTTKTFALDVPEFTPKNISVESSKQKKKADELSTKAREGQVNLQSRMSSEVKAIQKQALFETQGCLAKDSDTKFESVINDIDKNISVIQAGLDQARKVGATQIAEKQEESLKQLLEARANTVRQSETARAAINSAIQEQLDKLAVN